MYDSVLRKMRTAVRAGRIVLTEHAFDEMAADGLLQVDLERCILTGEILERQWDGDFLEWKYVIEGDGASNEAMAVVAKLRPKDKVIVITTYLL